MRGEPIHYRRPDGYGPEESDDVIARPAEPRRPGALLSPALGSRSMVRKVRFLYHAEGTPLHLDEVEGPEHCLESETVLSPGGSNDDGRREVDRLTARLGIAPEALVAAAYIDLPG